MQEITVSGNNKRMCGLWIIHYEPKCNAFDKTPRTRRDKILF